MAHRSPPAPIWNGCAAWRGADAEANRADALRLAKLMRTLNFLPKPTIARVNGAAYGGGVGLVACCDIAIGVEGAKFSLSEVKLGLVPAVISPYVIAAIGMRHARRLFVSGEVFDAAHAARIGLLHECVAAEALDDAVDRSLHFLAKGGPIAQREAKQLALRIGGATPESFERFDDSNADLIARLRVSPRRPGRLERLSRQAHAALDRKGVDHARSHRFPRFQFPAQQALLRSRARTARRFGVMAELSAEQTGGSSHAGFGENGKP